MAVDSQSNVMSRCTATHAMYSHAALLHMQYIAYAHTQDCHLQRNPKQSYASYSPTASHRDWDMQHPPSAPIACYACVHHQTTHYRPMSACLPVTLQAVVRVRCCSGWWRSDRYCRAQDTTSSCLLAWLPALPAEQPCQTHPYLMLERCLYPCYLASTLPMRMLARP